MATIPPTKIVIMILALVFMSLLLEAASGRLLPAVGRTVWPATRTTASAPTVGGVKISYECFRQCLVACHKQVLVISYCPQDCFYGCRYAAASWRECRVDLRPEFAVNQPRHHEWWRSTAPNHHASLPKQGLFLFTIRTICYSCCYCFFSFPFSFSFNLS